MLKQLSNSSIDPDQYPLTCAWCGLHLRNVPYPNSHGICPNCQESLTTEFNELNMIEVDQVEQCEKMVVDMRELLVNHPEILPRDYLAVLKRLTDLEIENASLRLQLREAGIE